MAIQLDREGIKAREDGESGGGRLFEGGGRLFKIFPSKRRDYSREAINRGRAIIRGNTVFKQR